MAHERNHCARREHRGTRSARRAGRVSRDSVGHGSAPLRTDILARIGTPNWVVSSGRPPREPLRRRLGSRAPSRTTGVARSLQILQGERGGHSFFLLEGPKGAIPEGPCVGSSVLGAPVVRSLDTTESHGRGDTWIAETRRGQGSRPGPSHEADAETKWVRFSPAGGGLRKARVTFPRPPILWNGADPHRFHVLWAKVACRTGRRDSGQSSSTDDPPCRLLPLPRHGEAIRMRLGRGMSVA